MSKERSANSALLTCSDTKAALDFVEIAIAWSNWRLTPARSDSFAHAQVLTLGYALRTSLVQSRRVICPYPLLFSQRSFFRS